MPSSGMTAFGSFDILSDTPIIKSHRSFSGKASASTAKFGIGR